MPSTAWITASGEGSSVINAGTPVAVSFVLLWVDSVTSPQVRVMGTAFPRRVMYAGSVQLCTDDAQPSGANAIAVLWTHAISFEFQDVGPFVPVGSNTANRIIWKLRPGVTCKFRVFW